MKVKNNKKTSVDCLGQPIFCALIIVPAKVKFLNGSALLKAPRFLAMAFIV